MSKRKCLNNLWAQRRARGLPQKRTAYFLGHKRTSQLSNWEKGKKYPNLKNVLKLEIIYHIPVAFLFRELYQELQYDIRRKEQKLREKFED